MELFSKHQYGALKRFTVAPHSHTNGGCCHARRRLSPLGAIGVQSLTHGAQWHNRGRKRDLDHQRFGYWTTCSTSWATVAQIFTLRHKLHDKRMKNQHKRQTSVCFVGIKCSVDVLLSAAQRSWKRGNCGLLLNRRTNHHNTTDTSNKYWFSWCFYQQSGSIMAQRDNRLYSLIVSYDSVHKKRKKKWECDKRRSHSWSWERVHMLIGRCCRVRICFHFSPCDTGANLVPVPPVVLGERRCCDWAPRLMWQHDTCG